MSLGPWAKSPLQALTSGVWKTEDCMRLMLSLNTTASATAEMVPKHKCVYLWRFLRVGLLSVDRVPFSNNGFNWPCNVGGC